MNRPLCENVVGRALITLGAAKIICYQRCYADQFFGKIPDDSCLPPSPTDARTASCIARLSGIQPPCVN